MLNPFSKTTFLTIFKRDKMKRLSDKEIEDLQNENRRLTVSVCQLENAILQVANNYGDFVNNIMNEALYDSNYYKRD